MIKKFNPEAEEVAEVLQGIEQEVVVTSWVHEENQRNFFNNTYSIRVKGTIEWVETECFQELDIKVRKPGECEFRLFATPERLEYTKDWKLHQVSFGDTRILNFTK